MFVRKNSSGELVAVGSIHHGKLAQLKAQAKRPKKAAPKVEEPKVEEPKVEAPAPVKAQPHKAAFKSVPDKKE